MVSPSVTPISAESPLGIALIRGLARRGYTLHGNLVFERRAGMGKTELVPRLLEELVASKVDVILAISYSAALAAKKGTTLPVVVYSAGDPVATGWSSVGATRWQSGISDVTVELSPKRLELLKEMTLRSKPDAIFVVHLESTCPLERSWMLAERQLAMARSSQRQQQQ